MHTVWLRLNAVGTFAGTVLAVLCILVTLTDQVHKVNPTASVELVSIDGLQKEYGTDRAWITLNMSADLRSLFTWNTKQVFLSVEVDFATKRHHVNQMMVWNSILKSKEDAVLHLPTLRPVYPFILADNGVGLRGRPFNVTLRWNVMPVVGALWWGSETITGFQFPSEYVKPEFRPSRY